MNINTAPFVIVKKRGGLIMVQKLQDCLRTKKASSHDVHYFEVLKKKTKKNKCYF